MKQQRRAAVAIVETTTALPTLAESPRQSIAKRPRSFKVPPQVKDFSFWHDVALHAKSWLDEDTETFNFVNEMPAGSLRKFEVQPDMPQNPILEDLRGSKVLAAFGRPMPFNYGCFPQTYRDPDQVDKIYGAAGDNDPLDVIDLSGVEAGVGEIVRCRPVGAVCLIDEGKADWKILVVSTRATGPISKARSLEDVRRLAPERITAYQNWIEDFLRFGGKDEAKLHLDIHDAAEAVRLIKQDHGSWRDLVAQADCHGTSKGHWIREQEEKRQAQPVALQFGTVQPGTAGRIAQAPSLFTNARRVALVTSARKADQTLRVSEYATCRSGRVLRAAFSEAPCATPPNLEDSQEVRRYVAPPPTDVSMWHDITLHVETGLEEDGLFNYVNEMPYGSLQKFEVQPHAERNAIYEDPEGSQQLASFGRPVPFNYGCFPQTYRDPGQFDELYGVPGDDDPLDVLDISDEPVGVGEIVRCRPLGAVCLIDDGKADWKILAVNTQVSSPLASARSIEDVERLEPGRIDTCLRWINELKQCSGGGEADTLHFEIHDRDWALQLIEQDHKSWRNLLSQTQPDGTSQGHWIRFPEKAGARPANAVNSKLVWVPSQVFEGRLVQAPRVFNGASHRRLPTTVAGAHNAGTTRRRSSGRVKRLATAIESKSEQLQQQGDEAKVPRYTAPPAGDTSLWHDISIQAEAGLFKYVNEMPLGSLQKFEVQPHVPHNAILEDPIGSSRLDAFGQPIPFNYGCFPQTYRDPDEVDELYGAPGDDDPLDVFDIGAEPVGVGEVLKCRPLGAVCLIDEGQADWKILAVNVEKPGILATARSVADVERMAPGRITACLRWMHDFKHSDSNDEATLHFEVHDADQALRLIEQDHVSWRRLVSQAGIDGVSRGHWIHPAKEKEKVALEAAAGVSENGRSGTAPSQFVGAGAGAPHRLSTLAVSARPAQKAATSEQTAPTCGVLSKAKATDPDALRAPWRTWSASGQA
jgi:inorganic pyrophosphatase